MKNFEVNNGLFAQNYGKCQEMYPKGNLTLRLKHSQEENLRKSITSPLSLYSKCYVLQTKTNLNHELPAWCFKSNVLVAALRSLRENFHIRNPSK